MFVPTFIFGKLAVRIKSSPRTLKNGAKTEIKKKIFEYLKAQENTLKKIISCVFSFTIETIIECVSSW